MCEAKMEHNGDGTYTVTVKGETRTFPDCVAAAEWADKKRFEIEEKKNDR